MQIENFEQFNNNKSDEGLLINLENNPLQEIPEPKMTIYAIANILNNIYFENKNKLDKYVKHNKKYVGESIIIDFLGEMAGRVDVVRITYSDNSVKYFSEENDLGYAIYNHEKSISLGEHIWEYEYGNLKDIYDELKSRGIKLENDVYGRQDELYSSVSDGFVEPLKRK